MLVGAAREIINPEPGHNLAGYGDSYPNEGCHDDLSCSALYLHDGKAGALLLNFDLIGMNGQYVEKMRQAIARETGVAADHILTACTHTHSGPEVREHWHGEPMSTCRPEYNKRLIGKAVAAAVAAKGNAEECDLHYNFAFAAENMNRRYNFPDRRSQYTPQNKQLAGLSSEYVDRELTVIAFRKRGTPNKYKAVVTVYTSHPLCVGNSSGLATADYQGYLRKTVEQTFAGCTCISLTGCAGDHHPLLPESGFAMAEKMGTNLGNLAIARCYDSIKVDYDTTLRAAWRDIWLPGRDERTNNLLPEAGDRARRMYMSSNGESKRHDLKIGLLGIGPILIAGTPGEPVAELGAMVRWSSPFLKTCTLFQSTDTIGYIPTANQYMWGGYEAVTSPFAQGAGEKLVEEILAAARGLVEEKPLIYPARGVEVIGY